MRTITLQIFFNNAAKGILKQGRASITDDGRCLYRGPDETKCAIGHSLTYKEYDPKLEGRSCVDIVKLLQWKGVDGDVLKYLQAIHDNAAFYYNNHETVLRTPEDFLAIFKENMLAFAKKYNLSTEGLGLE